MLQVARLAPTLLGESVDLVKAFLFGQITTDGAFKDRTGRGDLYYTVFGLDGLLALQTVCPAETETFLRGFGQGDHLDFVHLCCLTRCRATVAMMGHEGGNADWTMGVGELLSQFRAKDGGFHPKPGAVDSTVYACFLGLAAYQDLRIPVPEPGRLAEALLRLRTEDGAWANEARIPVGATNSTAAAVTALRNLATPVDPVVGDWLKARCHAQGGFVAAPGVPMPDLLSTATALHALSGLQRNISDIHERCLDFIDSLWTNEGAFHGHWDDPHLDVEYAYYGLLALGHLSL
jgi:prenyltransferase beta subunit